MCKLLQTRIGINREKPGVISEGHCWCIWLHEKRGLTWLYTGESLFETLWFMIKEWKHDRHLVG